MYMTVFQSGGKNSYFFQHDLFLIEKIAFLFRRTYGVILNKVDIQIHLFL